MRRVRATRTVLLLAALGLALGGCTGTPDDGPSTSLPSATDGLPVGDPTETAMPVAYTACGGAGFACAGQVEGVPYDIRMPDEWNGTLLIYSHGLRYVEPLDAEGPAFAPAAEAAPGLSGGVDVFADALLADGFALAGAGAPVGGWTVSEALAGVEAVRAAFVENVGVPNRIYTWGQSIGGVVALRAGEEYNWVNGSASLCGLLGGLNPNMDLALDTAVGVKALLAPKLQLTGFDSAEQARREFRRGLAAVEEAAADPTGRGLTSLQVIAAATELPTQTPTSPGGTRAELAAALVENLSRVLARATIERYGIEQDLGGNPSTNIGVNYGARVTADEAAAIDADAGVGATLVLVRQMASLPPVEADPEARAAADAEFPRPGALTKPIVTLHTAADPVAILANESLFSEWAAEVSGQEIRWLNVNVSYPPSPYPSTGRAPYGAGHCNFTVASVLGAVQVLDDWVALGRFPTWAGNAEAFGPNSGFAGPVRLPAWPNSPTTEETP
jgi:hypothetical protein